MSSPFQLYTHPHSANGRKVLALTYHLELNPDIYLINIYQGDGQDPDYLKINPFGKIPTLVDGEFILWESNAIMQYIAEKFGNNRLTATDLQNKTEIARWLFWEAGHWQPAISAVLTPAVGHRLLPDLFPEPTDEPNWEHPELDRWLNYLNNHLSEYSYLANDELSIADFSVAGMMTYFRFATFPFENFPALQEWYEHIESLPAWKKSESTLWARTI